MSDDDLQAAIDSSLQHANPLARRIYANHAWTASMVRRFVNGVMAATVATVRPDGRPHAAVTICGCLDGAFHFTVSDGSVLLRNLERQPAVAITVTDREHDLTAMGDAARAGRVGELPDLVRRLSAAVTRGQFVPEGWDGWIYTLPPAKVFLSR